MPSTASVGNRQKGTPHELDAARMALRRIGIEPHTTPVGYERDGDTLRLLSDKKEEKP